MLRSTRLEVDLDVVAHNFSEVRAILGSPAPARAPMSPAGRRFSDAPRGGRVAVAAVLKANAYGMGALAVAEVFLTAGADLLAVACLPEAAELRRAFPEARILVMGHTPDEYLPEAARLRVTATLFDLRQARVLSDAARTLGTRASIHVKVDTGMNRLGLKPDADTTALLLAMAALPSLELEGIFTHLALCDRDSDDRQFELFWSVVARAEEAGIRFRYRHACDSIGLMRYPEYRLDMVRAGAVFYGVKPMRTPLTESTDIRTPFALRTRVSRIRRIGQGEGVGYDYTFRAPSGGAVIATLPIGYADGYPRCLSNRASVVIRGKRAPVVGLICMDQLTVDVSAIPDASEGDEVLLLGGPASAQDEGDSIGVLEASNWALTNRNEMISAISRRVPRVYLRGGRRIAEVDYLLDEVRSHG